MLALLVWVIIGTGASIAHFVCSAREIIENRHVSFDNIYNYCLYIILNIINDVYAAMSTCANICDARDDSAGMSTAATREAHDGAQRQTGGRGDDSDPRPHSFARRLCERSGARLVRTTLPEWVHGRVCRDLITLRAGLSPEQELLTLVHELTHWLAHRGSHGPACIAPSSNTKPKPSRRW